MSTHHQFFILGPLTVHGVHGPVRLGGNRQRVLLTLLLLEANRVIGTDRLIEAVWREAPPATVRSQLRICVSGLRRLLSAAGVAAFIETHPSGYLIRVPRSHIDLAHFEDLLCRARAEARSASPERALTLFQQALQLWQGPVGVGLGSELLETVALKVNEDRLSAIEDRFELELALGRHRQVLGELARHVTENPFMESLCAQLMLALYRCGRTAEALSVYRDTRRRLARELGLEPGERLRRMERMILDGSAAGDASTVVPQSGLLAGPYAQTHEPQDRIAHLEREIAELRAAHLRHGRTTVLGDPTPMTTVLGDPAPADR
ncbi:BTAD domain-containing putative transcriptional regulator [Streptomyces atroolivaceus]|uniref:BTAD domain-containing putative transcriptional regulator n=1 Tax=Streptomyces atroolivaceus TaxID=66869 RepID=UPI00379B6402